MYMDGAAFSNRIYNMGTLEYIDHCAWKTIQTIDLKQPFILFSFSVIAHTLENIRYKSIWLQESNAGASRMNHSCNMHD